MLMHNIKVKLFLLFVWFLSFYFLGIFQLILNSKLVSNKQLLEIGRSSTVENLNLEQTNYVFFITFLFVTGIFIIFLKIPYKFEDLIDKIMEKKLFLIIIIFSLNLLQIILFWGNITDDRYINSRLAKNIGETFLPVINSGDTATPATSFVMPYVFSIFNNLSDYVGPAVFSITIYLLFFLGIIFYLKESTIKFLLLISMSLYPSALYWAVVGMETLIVLTFTGIIAILIKLKPESRFTSVLVGFLIWFRPELVLITIMFGFQKIVKLLLSIFGERNLKSVFKQNFKGIPELLIGPLLLGLIFITNFYPALPTPFYFKGSYGNSLYRGTYELFKEGLFDFTALLSSILILTVILLLQIFQGIFINLSMNNIWFKSKSFVRKTFQVNSLWPSIIILSIIYMSWGYNHMAFFLRYWAPIFVLLNIQVFFNLILNEKNENSEFLRKFLMSNRIKLISLQVLLTFCLLIYTNYLTLGVGISERRDWFSARAYTKFMIDNYENIQNDLRRVVKPGDTVFSYGAIQAMNLDKEVFVYDIYYNPVSITNNDELISCRNDFGVSKNFVEKFLKPQKLLANYPKGAQYPTIDCVRNFDYLVVGSQIPDEIKSSYVQIYPEIYKKK
jgi:hypothetical protein